MELDPTTAGPIAEALLAIAARAPSLAPARSEPVYLLYHGVPAAPQPDEMDAASFERQILSLKRSFDIVALDQVGRPHEGRRRVVITFDDGFRNNVEIVAPILRRHGVPAAFFVCSRHATGERFLWVSYIDMLRRFFRHAGFRWRGDWFDMRPEARPGTTRKLRDLLVELEPHPGAAYDAIESELPQPADFVPAGALADRYAGMTAEQIAELARDPLFTVGVHTSDHPMLSRCSDQEIARQVDDNRQWIEGLTGARCRSIAYPSGDYDRRVLAHVVDAGFDAGLAVMPRHDGATELERPRIGVYSRSQGVVGFKARWGSTLRRFRVAIG